MGEGENDYGDSIYSYDGFNHLTAIQKTNDTITYSYLPDGKRQTKTANGITTTHIWDADNIVCDVTVTTEQKYIRTLGLLAMQSADSINYYHLDGHNDTVCMTNEDGIITSNYAYDSFGNQTTQALTNDTNPFRYCGEYTDLSSGLIYLRNRYYNSSNGRFITEDPIRDDSNWYVYCSNNPIMFVDPWGLEYGKLRDFVNDYYGAFDGNVKIETADGLNYAYVTMGNYERAFYFDGTIVERQYDEYTNELISEKGIKIADNIDGTLYMQRSAFVIAMRMTKDGSAIVKTSDPIYVSSNLAMLDFAANINASVSSGSDVKDIYDILGKAPTVGKIVRNGVALYELVSKLKNGSILSTGNYRAEKIIVYSSANSLYSYEVNTLYGIDDGTSYYQWFEKRAHFGVFWDTIN